MEAVLYSSLGSLLTIIFQFLVARFDRKSDRQITERDKLELLVGELADLARHFTANKEVLRCIDIKKGNPSNQHFTKLKVIDTALILSPTTFLSINPYYSIYLNKIKLEIRNINLDIDEAILYKASSTMQLPQLAKHITYLKEKMENAVLNLPRDIYNHLDSSYELKIKIDRAIVEATGDRKIIYY